MQKGNATAVLGRGQMHVDRAGLRGLRDGTGHGERPGVEGGGLEGTHRPVPDHLPRGAAGLGEERLCFKAGDYAVFPAGEKTGHCLINETDAVCRYIVIGENNPNESCVYPDSNKVSNRWLGERYDRSAQRDYWDGEEQGG